MLFDTHALLWWLSGDERFPIGLRETEAEIWVSAASAWEISTKARIGKLPGYERFVADLPAILHSQDFRILDITLDHAHRAGSLPGPHRDPFDRMLIAQAHAENLPVVSADVVFDSYGIRRIW